MSSALDSRYDVTQGQTVSATKIVTEALVVRRGAVEGRVITSDASGNGTWEPLTIPYITGESAVLLANPTSGETHLVRNGNNVIFHLAYSNPTGATALATLDIATLPNGFGRSGDTPVVVGVATVTFGLGAVRVYDVYLDPEGMVLRIQDLATDLDVVTVMICSAEWGL